MKCVKYFFLLCGLMSLPAWGQSALKDEPYVVVRYVSVSCTSPAAFRRRVKPEIVLGSFDSFHATVLNEYPSLVLWHTSNVDQEEEMENLLGKSGTFSFPAVIVGSKVTTRDDQDKRDLSTHDVSLNAEHGETLQAHGMQHR